MLRQLLDCTGVPAASIRTHTRYDHGQKVGCRLRLLLLHHVPYTANYTLGRSNPFLFAFLQVILLETLF